MNRTGQGSALATLRPRVLGVVVAVLAASVVLTAIVGRWVLQGRLADRIDRDLAAEVDEFQRLVRQVDPRSEDPSDPEVTDAFDRFFAGNVPGADGVFLGLVGDRPYLRSADARYPVEELDEQVRRWSNRATATFGLADTPEGSLRYLVSPVTDPDGVVVGALVVGTFPGDARADVDAAAWTVAIVGLAAIVVAGAIGWAVLAHRSDAGPAGRAGTFDKVSGDVVTADAATPAPAAQQAFLDDAARELRAPVTVLRAHLENADMRRPLDAASREVVLGEIDRMGNIVADLALLADAARPDFLQTGPVDVAELTEEVATWARTLGERAWDVRPGTLVDAHLDRERVLHAWMHLVRNAVDHTWRSDRITVFSDVNDQQLELGVVDSGRGIAEQDAAALFEPFRRGADTARSSTAGGGLGLTVARAVAEAHGGCVEVRDTPGGGATVLLSVPLVRVGPLEQEPRWAPEARPTMT